MKQIILIRHTETTLVDMQPEERKKILDPELSTRGKKQAEDMTEFLKKYDYEVVFTSLYRRAQTVAQIVDSKKVKHISTNSFNEYYTLEGKGVESTSDGAGRAMNKLYSLFSLYDSIVIVAHSSINQTILQSLLNLKYEDARKYYNQFGEIQVIRYDWEKGDNNWRIIDSFIPSQD